jgi:hypothetical protein
MFADAFQRRRAIVPATVYYQRRTYPAPGSALPSRVSMAARWRSPGFGRRSDGRTVTSPVATASSPSRRMPCLHRSTTGCRSSWRSRIGRCGSENCWAIPFRCSGRQRCRGPQSGSHVGGWGDALGCSLSHVGTGSAMTVRGVASLPERKRIVAHCVAPVVSQFELDLN